MAQRTVAMCDGKCIGMLPAIDGSSVSFAEKLQKIQSSHHMAVLLESI